MQVEIWSDVICPWCYIGKRRFEEAMAQFDHRGEVNVIWKSYLLNPSLKTDPTQNILQHLAEVKGWTEEYTKNISEHVCKVAQSVGLDYHMGKVIVANSFDAHRLIQFSKDAARGDAIEEALFKAYFINGQNIADHKVLSSLAVEVGLQKNSVEAMLQTQDYANAVQMDVFEAKQMQCTGVPFFLFNNKYSISGAQATSVFLDLLKKTWNEDNKINPLKNLSFLKN